MALSLTEYDQQVAPTDSLPRYDIRPILFGLFGEVGSIMTVAKKHYRESEAYTAYQSALEEEFGDVLWYLAALCRRVDIRFDAIFPGTISSTGSGSTNTGPDIVDGPVAPAAITSTGLEFEPTLLQLGEAAGNLLAATDAPETIRNKLPKVATLYVRALQQTTIQFSQIMRANSKKVRGRFLQPKLSELPTFDHNFPLDEQLPSKFAISIIQRPSGRCYLKWNGVFIGDPLTDQIADRDDYRFHDVFHFAHAAILHWSPTFRGLIKHKRKSDKEVDETQDGGRAIVVEEGLTAWIFSRAKELNFFADRKSLSFDLLKTIQQFVSGYEVEECPLRLWENAILSGYDIFRQVRDNNGGTVVGDREQRAVTYRPLRGNE